MVSATRFLATSLLLLCSSVLAVADPFDPQELLDSDLPASTSHHVDKSARIAIVGGGVAGVSAAETLLKIGFTNVVVLEAGSSIVPIHHHLRTDDGNVYDLDLVYVPALSWKGPGVEPRFQAILDEYNQELVPVSEFSALSREDWHLNATGMRDIDGRRMPELHSYTATRLDLAAGRMRLFEVQRFYHDYAAFFERHQYSGIQACLHENVARSNETFNHWAQRNDYNVLRESVIHILNLYGNFPVGDSPACQVLMLLANKMPSILGPSLGLAAVQPDFRKWLQESPVSNSVDTTMVRWLMHIARGTPAFMHRFKHGYGAFFRAVVEQNQMDYRTDMRVKQLVPFMDPVTERERVVVQFATQPSEVFDHVLVAGRPDQIHGILPNDHPMTPLYETVKTAAHETTQAFGVYTSAVLSFAVSPRAGMVAQDRFVIDHQKHHAPMYEGRMSAVVNLLRIVKMTDAKVLSVVFHTHNDAVDTESEQQLLIQELELYGFYDLQVLKIVHYPNTPTRVPVQATMDGWYDQATAAQGHQQLFFIGETFAGHGVPTTFLHTRDWCLRTFQMRPSRRVAPLAPVKTCEMGLGDFAVDLMETGCMNEDGECASQLF